MSRLCMLCVHAALKTLGLQNLDKYKLVRLSRKGETQYRQIAVT
jgi:hypothetical protein